jgi:hypothetical protein
MSHTGIWMVKKIDSAPGNEWIPMSEEDKRVFLSVIKYDQPPDDNFPVCVEGMQMKSASMGPVLISLEKCEASRHGSEVIVEREEDYKVFESEGKVFGWQAYKPSESLLMNFMYHAGFKRFSLHSDLAGVDHCEKAVDLNFMIQTDVASSATRNIRIDWKDTNYKPMFLVRHVSSMSDWLPLDKAMDLMLQASISNKQYDDVNLSTMQVRTKKGLFDVAFSENMELIKPHMEVGTDIRIVLPDNSVLNLNEHVVDAIRYMTYFKVPTFTLHNVEGLGLTYIHPFQNGQLQKMDAYIKKMVLNMTTKTALILYGWHGSNSKRSFYARIEVDDANGQHKECNKRKRSSREKAEEAHSILNA